mmetsp:Transcript_18877/g.49074  ORF Transcript_18877/g.49074 Transcript_18877/m.49074 type:complete len:159 (-) Transcript_18877:128-604(-)
MARLCILALLVAVPGAAAVLGGSRTGQQAVSRKGKTWPFSGSLSSLLHGSAEPSTAAAAGSTEHRKSIQDIKDDVMLSAAFGKKTDALCMDAAESERAKCRQLAGGRLFCALMHRHEERYAGMPGAAEEKERCSEVDTMETAVEAATDAHLQEEADKA